MPQCARPVPAAHDGPCMVPGHSVVNLSSWTGLQTRSQSIDVMDSFGHHEQFVLAASWGRWGLWNERCAGELQPCIHRLPMDVNIVALRWLSFAQTCSSRSKRD
eukprot:jgi/Ulvmu1/6715/UM030_0048.1